MLHGGKSPYQTTLASSLIDKPAAPGREQAESRMDDPSRRSASYCSFLARAGRLSPVPAVWQSRERGGARRQRAVRDVALRAADGASAAPAGNPPGPARTEWFRAACGNGLPRPFGPFRKWPAEKQVAGSFGGFSSRFAVLCSRFCSTLFLPRKEESKEEGNKSWERQVGVLFCCGVRQKIHHQLSGN